MNSRLLCLVLAGSFYAAGLVQAATAPERTGTAKGEAPRTTMVSARAQADYVLQPQDILSVSVFQHDDINKLCDAISISQENTVTLPMIGTVKLAGKTARQAEDLIRELYDRDYIVNPQVSVVVRKYAERAVNVVGQVNKPGRIQFPNEQGLTIVEAISEAGGPTRLAELKKVKLTRRNADGEMVTEEVNVDAMLKGGGRDALVLRKDDSVFVPERVF